MTSTYTSARAIWRITRLTARHMDRRIPNWWKDPRAVEAVTRPTDDVVTRCWRELIKQRTGEDS